MFGQNCPTHWTCDEIIEPRNGLIIAIIRHTRFNFGTELVQEDHSQTFFHSSLWKLNMFSPYANFSLGRSCVSIRPTGSRLPLTTIRSSILRV